VLIVLEFQATKAIILADTWYNGVECYRSEDSLASASNREKSDVVKSVNDQISLANCPSPGVNRRKVCRCCEDTCDQYNMKKTVTRKPERTIKYVPAVLIIAIVSVGLEDFKHQVLQISVRWVFHGFDPESIVLGYKYMCMVHHFFSGLWSHACAFSIMPVKPVPLQKRTFCPA
jgi:hypothetical protein